jgi:hypothetical protein
VKGVLVIAVLAVFAGACGTVNVAPQTISLAFKAGQTYKYKFHSTTKQAITMSAMSIATSLETSADESVKVSSVDSSGTADLTLTLSNLTLKTVTGDVTNTTTIAHGDTYDLKIGSNGLPVSTNGSTISTSNPFLAFSALGGSVFISAILPDHPVKQGDTWTKSYDQTNPGPTTGTIHIIGNSKYLRDETLNGIKAAVVETKSTGAIDLSLDMSKLGTGSGAQQFPGGALSSMTIKGTLTTDVTSWIDPGGHRVMKSHSTSTDEGALDIVMSPSASASAPTMPGLTGPISVKGSTTTDLTPA